MEYTLKELLNIPRLLDLLDSLDEIHSMPSAIIDTEGNVLTATAWQEICTNFHRVNPESEKKCIESDRQIKAQLDEETPHVIYRCPMGMIDSATPIIIDGKHLGNVFTGQLFLEPPDEDYFIKQARQYGFDEDEYLAAVRKVPLFTEEKLHKNLNFIAKLAQMLAEQGLQHKRQCEAEANLREAEWKFRALFDNGPIGVAYHRMIYDDSGKPVDYYYIDANDKFIELTGIDPRGKTVLQAFPGFENEEFDWIETYGHVARTGETIRFQQYFQLVKRWYDCVGYQYKPDHFVVAFIDITERKQNEEALRESELNYRTLADSGQALIWKARPDKLCDYFNKVWLDFTGRTYEQEFGNGWAEGVHPDDFQRCLDTYITAFDNREAFSIDYRLRRHDGEYRWLQDDGCPRYDMNGNFSGYIGYCLDITDRKLIEKKLLHASEEWRKTFDTIPDMITILDSEHRIVRANRATSQKLGCDLQDMNGKPCYTFFHGSDSPPENCPHGKLMQDGLAHSVDLYELKLNGFLDVTVTPLRDSDGEVIGSIHVAHDITALKQTEAALRESESLYRSILAASPDNITITDMEGRIRMISPKGLTMFGYEHEEEMLGRSVIEFIGPEDRERATADLMLALKGDYTWPGEFQAIRSDGSKVIIEANGDFILDSNDQPASMIFAVRDITERKRIEHELNSKNAEIEQFIYTVSHDLRSPLVTVKTFLGYLEQDIPTGNNERIGKDLEFMNTATDRMETQLNELLDMSKIGRLNTHHETVTFQQLVGEALAAVAGQITAGRVNVEVDAANPKLRGDQQRLLQIWQNLLDNALKYMGDQTEPAIVIGINQKQGEPVFFVCDNGIGIAPEYHEKVFGIFEKLEQQSGGVGMGLTMVKRIVETYGGHIRVESEGNGKGACFYFTLPQAVSNG